MKIILQTLFVVAAVVAGINASKIKQCRGDNPPPIKDVKLQLSDCKDQERCDLKRGETYKFEVQFKALQNGGDLKTVGLGEIFKEPITVKSVGDSDACQHIKDSKGKKGCPLKKGQKYTYKRDVHVADDEYMANIRIDWKLQKKESNETVHCVQTFVRIRPKDS